MQAMNNDKLSQYNVEVEHDDYMLLFNGLTSKLLPVSYEQYAALETLMEHLPEFQKMYPELYESFKASGFIVDQDFDELAYIKLQNKRKVLINKDYHITINPTLDCNLKCWYCSVSYAGAKHNKERMSDETVDALKKHILHLVKDQGAASILLDWFGGEPTMYYDEVIREVCKFIKEEKLDENVNIRQQITTNATFLNEKRIREMRDHKFTFFQITIDGNEQRHNKIKYFSDKSGSYKKVMENINLIAEIIPNIAISLRINYDEQTLKNITDVLADLKEKTRLQTTVDFQRVWQVPCTDELRQLLADAKETFKNAGFRSTFWAYKPLAFKRCYADNINHYAINYNGKIFKCTARDYGDDLVLGTLNSLGMIDWNDSLLSKYFEKATFENELCEKCNMLPLCMGPCIQKCYDNRRHNTAVKCMYENVEYSLDSYVKDVAKQRNLI